MWDLPSTLLLFHNKFNKYFNNTGAPMLDLSVTIHINCSVARCLINLVYFTAFAFIRSWWRCTFLMTSPMMLNWHKKLIITSYSLVWRVNQLGKLINRIPGSRLLISSLPGSTSWMHVKSLGKPHNVNKGSQILTW